MVLRLRLDLDLVRVMVRGLVAKFKIRCCGMYFVYVYESPHKYRNKRMCMFLLHVQCFIA